MSEDPMDTSTREKLAPPTPTRSRKRPSPDDSTAAPATPQREQPSNTSSTLSSPISIEDNPFEDNQAGNVSSSKQANGTAPAVQSNSNNIPQPPPKRRKLTAQEKEAQRIEKEQKAKEKEERKTAKEEELRAKEEEKRKKQEEREEKKREQELEKSKKEQEKKAKEQAREEERLKREKAQPKLLAFFGGKTAANTTKKITPNGTPTKNNAPVKEDAKPTLLSVESIESVTPFADSKTSPQKTPQKHKSDYERTFLPYEIPSYTVLAPINPYVPDEAQLAQIRSRLEVIPTVTGSAISIVQEDFSRRTKPHEAIRGQRVRPVTDLITALQGSPSRPIDLTGELAEDDALALLRATSMKYLHFGEDVRPPYSGTYTKNLSHRQKRHLCLNPTSRILPETNYDYDSEAEWEEPEEGEDIDLGDDEEEEEDEDDEMEDFLDDEEDAGRARGPLVGDLVPVSTGICWEDSSGKLLRPEGSGNPIDMGDCCIGFLLEPAPRSINPFSTVYWALTSAPTTLLAPPEQTVTGLMNPPRLPLVSRPNATNGVVPKTAIKPDGTLLPGAAPKPPKAVKRMIPPELMDDFRKEVDGSDLTKLALIEALKKKFQKQPKDAITNTLNAIAARVGESNASKRWRLVQQPDGA